MFCKNSGLSRGHQSDDEIGFMESASRVNESAGADFPDEAI